MHEMQTQEGATGPMSLKFAVLGLLTERRSYGYELAQRLQDRLGAAWQLNPSAVYGALDQLERDDLIREVPAAAVALQRGATKRRAGRVVYETTERGAVAFRDWLRQPSARQEPIRAELQLKVSLADAEDLPALVEAIEREEWRVRALRKRCLPASPDHPHASWPEASAALVRAAVVGRLDAELAWLSAAREALSGFVAPAAGASLAACTD